MASMNRVILIGNLGADPELTDINGNTKCKLRLATSRKYTDKQGQLQEKTQWHTISVWGKQADTCGQYLSKGRSVCVEGSIEYSKSEKDGIERWFTDIRAQSVTFLGGGQQNGGGQQGGGGNQHGGGQQSGGQQSGGQQSGGSPGWGGNQQPQGTWNNGGNTSGSGSGTNSGGWG